jgi:hypothetical protein
MPGGRLRALVAPGLLFALKLTRDLNQNRYCATRP